MARGASISTILSRIDGRGYAAYRELLGARERVDGVELIVVRVQPDPYAPPSVVRAEARLKLHRLSKHPVPVADYAHRLTYTLARRYSRRIGDGHSGVIATPRPSNAMLRRSAAEVEGDKLILRLWVGLPSRKRRILGKSAEKLLLETIPFIVKTVASKLVDDNEKLIRHVDVWVEQEYIRSVLEEVGAVAFIGEGSILPRRCGTCEEPLPDAKPFKPPPSLRVEIDLPTGKRVAGMLLRRGVTVIAGSAFHGKTTLAEAIALGIYNHVPGDGREYVVSLRDTVVIRAEDGRSISCVDVSTFIHDLPGGVNVECFSTQDASGATSTAAAIQEAVEAGAKLLVLDEDYVASNMLYTDPVAFKLARVVSISPLTSKAVSMKEKGLSLIIVTQGHEPLLSVADTVLVMENYEPRDVTLEAKKIARHGLMEDYEAPKPRVLEECRVRSKLKLRGFMLEAKGLERLVNLWNPQLVEEPQYNTILALIARATMFEGMEVSKIVERVDMLVSEGFRQLLGHEPGPAYAEIRGIDLAYALNRLPFCRFRLRPAT